MQTDDAIEEKENNEEKIDSKLESIGQVSHQHLFSRICPLGGADQKVFWLFLCLVPSKSSFGLFLTGLILVHFGQVNFWPTLVHFW